MFANKQDIRLLDYYFLRGPNNNPRGNTSILVKDLKEATALDIHFAYGLVCWSDIEEEKIKCTSFDKSITTKALGKLKVPKSFNLDEHVSLSLRSL